MGQTNEVMAVQIYLWQLIQTNTKNLKNKIKKSGASTTEELI